MKRENAQMLAGVLVLAGGLGLLIGLKHWSGLPVMLAGSFILSWGNPHVHPSDL